MTARAPHRIFLGAALLCTIACAGLTLLAPQVDGQAELRAAQAKWASASPAAYRIVLDAGARCALSVEVRDERIVRLQPRDTCVPPARSVGELFGLITTLDEGSSPCAASGCVCRTVTGSSVRFDPRLGYPRSITVWTRHEPDLWNADYWGYLVGHIGQPLPCTDAIEGLVVRVVSLTPLR